MIDIKFLVKKWLSNGQNDCTELTNRLLVEIVFFSAVV